MDSLAQADAFFAGRPEAWAVFEALRTALCARFPDTQLRVMKTCISFDDPKPYCYVSKPKNKAQRGIVVTFSLRERMESPRFMRVVPISKSRFTVHVLVQDAQEIDGELLSLISLARSQR